ncbi:MAG: hypothetical protein HLUCCA04_00920 [Oceanicaulis sp. HLUCCA04]|nr:MAG: hypothetical protein HLUCCA04_00920 [Oceanicaulis sp. HLUCCA04]
MSAASQTRRARPAAGIFVVDHASGRFALPALPGSVPLAYCPVSARTAVDFGPGPDLPPRLLGVRSLSSRAFSDAALNAAHAQLGLVFASPASGVASMTPQTGLWGRAARHGLAPDRGGLVYLGRSVFETGQERWHMRLFAISHARAVQALFPVTPGGRAVWISQTDMAARLAQAELTPFVSLASAASAGMNFTPLHVRKQAGRLRATPL